MVALDSLCRSAAISSKGACMTVDSKSSDPVSMGYLAVLAPEYEVGISATPRHLV